MAISTDVNLPRVHIPQYPQRCVRCGADPQGKTIKIWTHTIGWWTYLLWAFGKGFTTNPPACSACARRIRMQRVGRHAVPLLIAALVMVFIWPLLDENFVLEFRKWIIMGGILFCCAPYFVWEVFFPPTIDITAYKDSVDYEFADEDYAYDFTGLNDDAEWVELS
jgi:hypothetical protein